MSTSAPSEQFVRFGNLLEIFQQGTTESLQLVTEFAQKQTASNLINLLSFNYPKALKELLMCRLMLVCRQISNVDIGAMTYETMLELVSREDYEPSSTRGLEVVLCSIFCRWFFVNPKESRDNFAKCYGLLRHELLDMESLANIVKTPQYQLCRDQLDRGMVELYTAIQLRVAGPTTKQTQRCKYQPKLLNQDEIASLRKGDLVDACDSGFRWYTGMVEELIPKNVYVSFQGWDARNNEWIPVTDERLAVYGSVTNRCPHHGRSCESVQPDLCVCYSCQIQRGNLVA